MYQALEPSAPQASAPSRMRLIAVFLLGMATSAILATIIFETSAKTSGETHSQPQKVTLPTFKPLASSIKPGATVSLFSPASTLLVAVPNITAYQSSVQGYMTSQLGVKNTEFTPNAFGEYFYFSGTDQQRYSDLSSAFSSSMPVGQHFLVANRGGWGSDRLLSRFDFHMFSSSTPKPIIGYSDVTTILNTIALNTGLVTFHGPMGVDQWTSGWNAYLMSAMLFQQTSPIPNASYPTHPLPSRSVYDTSITSLPLCDRFPLVLHNLPPPSNNGNIAITAVNGTSRGRLYGGNLSVFVSLLGTNYLPQFWTSGEPYVLFIEEVTELPYRIDRMMVRI